MPYWIDLVLDNDKGAPTYLQRASPSVIMEFRRWPDVPTPGIGDILPMKLVFKGDFEGKYMKQGANNPTLTEGVPGDSPTGPVVVFTSKAGTSEGKDVQEVRIMLKPSPKNLHPVEGYAFDVLMQGDNGAWKTWDPRVVSK